MKLSDYIADFLFKEGIRHVFVVSGGAIVHCIDSVSRHPKMKVICTQHEQGAGAAADGYARISENLGAAMVTSGPGATNLTTSIANAYFDSIPVIFICGQVATFRIKRSAKLRQKGFQETDVVSLFGSITKYVKQIRDPKEIKYELQKAVYLAREGRPGPVALDVPDDLQRAEINPGELPAFVPPPQNSHPQLAADVQKLFSMVREVKRPVLIFGMGIRLAKARDAAVKFAEYFGLPVLLTWGGKEILAHVHPLNMGTVGVCGPRPGNFAAQNSDLVIGMGTRLCQMVTGGKQNLFAPHAKKVMVDIDPEEFAKFTENDFKLDFSICAHLKEFFVACERLYGKEESRFAPWREQIKAWQKRYPVVTPDLAKRRERVNGVVFLKELSSFAKKGSVIVADTGANLAWTMQTFEVKENQRIISAWNHTPMGYALPASAGAALAAGRDVICITGDGGIMMSLEELGTIRRHNLPVKIFIMFNHGHGIQRQTMDTWLNSRYTAVDEKSGLYFPDFGKVAAGFGLPFVPIKNHRQIRPALKKVFGTRGPVVCCVEIVKDERIVPMLKFGAGLEDLDPKLPPEELAAIMKISQK